MNQVAGIISLILIFGCCGCLLPILAIYFGIKKAQNDTNKKTEIMLKAIENGQKVDAQMFANSDPVKKNIKLTLLGKLKSGIAFGILGLGIGLFALMSPTEWIEEFRLMLYMISIVFFALGIANIVFYIVGQKQLKGEMEAELKKAEAEAEKAGANTLE